MQSQRTSFSICDAAETGEATEPDGSESPVNNSPEQTQEHYATLETQNLLLLHLKN
jgi:hypothetical protein